MGMSGINEARPRPRLKPLFLTDEVVDALAAYVALGWHEHQDVMIRRLALGGATAEQIAGANVGLNEAVVQEILDRSGR